MIWVDWAIVGTLLISTGLSWLKGFISEAISLGTWFLAIVIIFAFSPSLATVLIDAVDLNYQGRLWVARIVLFLSTLVVGAVIKRLGSHLVRASGLTTVDRVLGMAFGLARGVLLLLVATTFLRWVSQPETTAWWQQSVLIPYLQIVEQNTLALAEGLLSSSITGSTESQ